MKKMPTPSRLLFYYFKLRALFCIRLTIIIPIIFSIIFFCLALISSKQIAISIRYAFAYFIICFVIANIFVIICMKNYGPLSVYRLNHVINGNFYYTKQNEIIHDYVEIIHKIQNDYAGKTLTTTTHTYIIMSFIMRLGLKTELKNFVKQLKDASKHPDRPFTFSQELDNGYKIDVKRSKKGIKRDGVMYNPLRIMPYLKKRYSDLNANELDKLLQKDTFYNVKITFPK